MTALDQQIGTGDDPAVEGREHRTVVANTKHAGRVWRQHRTDSRNEAELTEIGDGNDVLPGDRLAGDHSASLR